MATAAVATTHHPLKPLHPRKPLSTIRWKDVPEPVWHYTLGGYQVLKKWLSYREQALLNRPLIPDEAQQFTHQVRRITSILAENAYLDEHYRKST